MGSSKISFPVLIHTMRPSFLILTPVCLFLGLSTALSSGVDISYVLFSIIFVGALFAHISVNMLNEYHDFKSGLDLKTNKTAFSGGSGALPNNPDMATDVLIIGASALLITLMIGIYLVLNNSLIILPIGITGIILVVTYTQWLNKYPLLCFIAPGLGFGLLMVSGTHILLTKDYTSLPLFIPIIPFLLINNLLLLNQYPDIQADTRVGRKTFPIVYGITKSNIVYAFSFLAAFGIIAINLISNNLPQLSFIALIPIFLSFYSLMGAKKHTKNIGHYPHYLASNVAVTLITPVLLGISIL